MIETGIESDFVFESLYPVSYTEQTLRDPYHPYTPNFIRFPRCYDKVVIKNIDHSPITVYVVDVHHSNSSTITSFRVYPNAIMNKEQFRKMRGKNLSKKLSL